MACTTIFCECGQEYRNPCPKCPYKCPYCASESDDYKIIKSLWDGDLFFLLEAIKEKKIDFFGNQASVNYRGPFGETPLSIACSSGNLDLFETLVKMGADVNLPDVEGWSPLMFAASEDQHHIFKKLISLGAITNHADENGQTWETVLFNKELLEIYEDVISKHKV